MNNRDKFLKNFIVLEGLDGAGTTTLLDSLVSYFNGKGIRAVRTAEPTPSPIGLLIRNEYLKGKNHTTPLAMALLYSADRENHINNSENGVKKLLEKSIVISDRYFYSSLAYQGVNLDFAVVNALNNFEQPEVLIYINTPVDECLKRIDKRGEEKELFEKREFLTKTKENFEKAFEDYRSTALFKQGKIKFKEIDGLKSKEEVLEEAVKFLEAYFLQG